MPRGPFRRQLAAALLVVVTLATAVLGTGDALGDPIADKQAEAREVADRLERLERKVEILAEQYNDARLVLAEVNREVILASAEARRTQARLASRQREMASYAVDAYVRNEDAPEVSAILDAEDGNTLSRRSGYARAATGNRADVVDRLRGARAAADEDVAALHAAQEQARKAEADVAAKRSDTQATVDEARQVNAEVQGELASLVRAERARRAAEAARKARIAAQRQADQQAALARQQAAAAARRAPTTIPAPAAVRGPAPTAPSTLPAPAAVRGPAPTCPRTRPAPHHRCGPGPAPAPPPGPAPTPTPPPRPAAPRRHRPRPRPRPRRRFPADPAPPVGQGAEAAIAAGRSVLGVRYTWGGASPSTGFDCSGFVMWAWEHGGKSLPHSSRAMYAMSRRIPMSAIQPGDLIFYGQPTIHHVALYMGNGQIIHSPSAGSSVRIDSVYYWDELVGAGRV